MRCLVLSDEHCGHMYGLTCPSYQLKPDAVTSGDRFLQKAYEWQTNTWSWFWPLVNKLGPYDVVVNNGDALEGKGERSGSTELITADRNRQVDIAYNVLSAIDTRKYVIVRGTPSHTGVDEDWEDVLAERLGVQAQDHAFLEHGGKVMDFKHHIGSSSVPGSMPPALGREAVWNLLWAEHDLQPRSHLVVRSHLHKHHFTGDENFTAIVTPALQGWTKYGAKRMSKTITFGFVVIDITDEGEISWEAHTLIPTFAKANVEHV